MGGGLTPFDSRHCGTCGATLGLFIHFPHDSEMRIESKCEMFLESFGLHEKFREIRFAKRKALAEIKHRDARLAVVIVKAGQATAVTRVVRWAKLRDL